MTSPPAIFRVTSSMPSFTSRPRRSLAPDSTTSTGHSTPTPHSIWAALAIGTAACLASPAVQADYLDGSTIFYNPLSPSHPDPLGGPYAATVGSGTEYSFLISPSNTPLGSIDVQDQAIRIQFDHTGTWQDFILQFDIAPSLPSLVSVRFGPETSLLYRQNAALSFSGHRIALDVSGIPIGQNLVVLDLNAAPVPEPDSTAMLLAGLGTLGWLTRRQHRARPAPTTADAARPHPLPHPAPTRSGGTLSPG